MAETVIKTIEETLRQNGIQIKILNSPFSGNKTPVGKIDNNAFEKSEEQIKEQHKITMDDLKVELQKAIDAEDFEAAAKLRDEISNFKD